MTAVEREIAVLLPQDLLSGQGCLVWLVTGFHLKKMFHNIIITCLTCVQSRGWMMTQAQIHTTIELSLNKVS